MKLAVFGNPIEHSRSPEIHQMFAAAAGISISYEKVLVPQGEFSQTADAFLKDGHGFNVTLPCKGDAFQFCDEVSESAEVARAVNTVQKIDNRIMGHNTDGPGLVNDLIDNLGWPVKDRRILILGAGGAVAGVLNDLRRAGPAELHLWNRTHQKAESLAKQVGGDVRALSSETLQESYDLVINGTSSGLSGDVPVLPQRIFDRASCAYDMVYSTETTPFCAWSQAAGCAETSDGLGMLVEQAALAFKIWTGHEVSTATVINQLRGS